MFQFSRTILSSFILLGILVTIIFVSTIHVNASSAIPIVPHSDNYLVPPNAPNAGSVVFLPTIMRTNSSSSNNRRPWRDTSSGIHVFNDQLATDLSDAQWQFAATHYVGTQKMTRPYADRLRAINPNFLILHYRLGLGLGYRTTSSGCNPSGGYLYIVEGNTWVQEWYPGATENWFYHYPEVSATRVLQCDWGWYVMELNDSGWRSYWQSQVLQQLQANDNDGLFLDSLSIPNYLGGSSFNPALPAYDLTLENAWATRINAWLTWLQTQPAGDYYIVPNVGSWITTRDPTNYSPVDGVMIEGFAIQGDADPYDPFDWRLQANRILGLVAQNKAVIGQTYVTGAQERMFALGTYLLLKGSRTYFNLETDMAPEWWPEYDVPIGAPTQNAGTNVDNLYDSANHVYRRNFTNGFVLVNPTGSSYTVNLGGTYYRVSTSGGGLVPFSGIPSGSVTTSAVSSVTLPAYSAVVLLTTP